MINRTSPSFFVSLDFELMWGVRDKRTIASYGKNILGAREAIPHMLKLFRKYEVKATWAVVGLLLFDNKKDMLAHFPEQYPTYSQSTLSPYENSYIETVGDNEKDDPYHYGLSLAKQIVDCDGMELGSHTFCHYYCLEKGQNKLQFRADLEAAIQATQRLTAKQLSLVFPRNQCNLNYMSVCAYLGLRAIRGNEASWIYRESAAEDISMIKRGSRLIDAYLNVSGDNGFDLHLEDGIVNVPASRFLRPYNKGLRLLESMRINRIKNGMSMAAKYGKSFHLWWHPHNFGVNIAENLSVLETLLRHHANLKEKYQVISMTMGEVAGQLGDVVK